MVQDLPEETNLQGWKGDLAAAQSPSEELPPVPPGIELVPWQWTLLADKPGAVGVEITSNLYAKVYQGDLKPDGEGRNDEMGNKATTITVKAEQTDWQGTLAEGERLWGMGMAVVQVTFDEGK